MLLELGLLITMRGVDVYVLMDMTYSPFFVSFFVLRVLV